MQHERGLHAVYSGRMGKIGKALGRDLEFFKGVLFVIGFIGFATPFLTWWRHVLVGVFGERTFELFIGSSCGVIVPFAQGTGDFTVTRFHPCFPCIGENSVTPSELPCCCE